MINAPIYAQRKSAPLVGIAALVLSFPLTHFTVLESGDFVRWFYPGGFFISFFLLFRYFHFYKHIGHEDIFAMFDQQIKTPFLAKIFFYFLITWAVMSISIFNYEHEQRINALKDGRRVTGITYAGSKGIIGFISVVTVYFQPPVSGFKAYNFYIESNDYFKIQDGQQLDVVSPKYRPDRFYLANYDAASLMPMEMAWIFLFGPGVFFFWYFLKTKIIYRDSE